MIGEISVHDALEEIEAFAMVLQERAKQNGDPENFTHAEMTFMEVLMATMDRNDKSISALTMLYQTVVNAKHSREYHA